jgi:RNA polymerase primary sigma factor
MSFEEFQKLDLASLNLLSRPEVQLLGIQEEQELLLELDRCRRSLRSARPETAHSAVPTSDADEDSEPAEDDGDAIQDLVRSLLQPNAGRPLSELEQRLASVAARYSEIRTRLAMANLRLVAHVARKYRDRGLSTSDLLQEGFCGLLKSIDRFDPAKKTRLASYAVWWIRQSLQKAVAACAYPVKLNPRHLRQLAQSSPELTAGRTHTAKPTQDMTAGTVRQILSATRPTVSLNARLRSDQDVCLLDALMSPEHEDSAVEANEDLASLMGQLKPREQTVLRLRFGLDGQECRSLSQVSEVLDVSKERIRQIQESALKKLRKLAVEKQPCETAG